MRRDIGGRPYGNACRGGRLCPPGADNTTPCRAGPVCPAVGAGKNRSGRRGRRPLRKRILWCVGEGLCPSRGRPQGSPLRRVIRGAVREESPSHGFAVPAPFRQGAEGTGRADCHSQCAHWLRNDMFFCRGAWQVVPCAVAHMGATLRRLMVKKRAG